MPASDPKNQALTPDSRCAKCGLPVPMPGRPFWVQLGKGAVAHTSCVPKERWR